MNAFQGVLTSQQADILARLVDELSPEQILWVSSYLAGFGDARRKPAPALAVEALPDMDFATLFGWASGNAEPGLKARNPARSLAPSGHLGGWPW